MIKTFSNIICLLLALSLQLSVCSAKAINQDLNRQSNAGVIIFDILYSQITDSNNSCGKVLLDNKFSGGSLNECSKKSLCFKQSSSDNFQRLNKISQLSFEQNPFYFEKEYLNFHIETKLSFLNARDGPLFENVLKHKYSTVKKE